MTKRILALSVALVMVLGMTMLAGGTRADDKSWTGYLTDSMCAAKGGASVKDGECAKRCVGRGDKYVLFIPDNKKAYALEPQAKLEEHAGHYVTVKGTLDGDTIKVTSIEPAREPSGK
jgi:hypothetical protein